MEAKLSKPWLQIQLLKPSPILQEGSGADVTHHMGDLHRGAASSDAIISANTHLSGETRTASVIREQESSSRKEVGWCQQQCHPVGSTTRTARPSHCVDADRE